MDTENMCEACGIIFRTKKELREHIKEMNKMSLPVSRQNIRENWRI